ncbi:aldo/keto reductase [Paenibacillus roseipurpureus]|uniref:Aldo/keto reductase n=1 Tax=Paenibacillus roseopurpureus TaxID=2918901 RepID=A0AA96LQ75_9BACL|nr:aldo/keto reductase [Paenibacillus sp. MBLB1832]WNR42865.1 aldo/keto reductase [Paenibacillus sp. MBLB1832]
MQYTEFGRTGLRVSRLGLGGAPLAGDFGPTDEREVELMIHEAIDGGINFVDTAVKYGNGESERRIGNALRGGRRNQIVLTTKAVGNHGDFSYASTIESVEGSLQRLKTDWVDLLQIHDAERTSFEIVMEETLPALEKLREQGKLRFIGISTRRLPLLMQYVQTGRFDSIQFYVRYMLIDHSAKDELLPLTQEYGLGVINGSVLSMGLLADTPAKFLKPDIIQEAQERMEKLRFLRRGEPYGLVEPAMRFSLTQPAIHVTLTGASTREVLRTNMAYCDGQGLAPDDQARVFELFAGQQLFQD